ncbi:hypothetical protein GCM10027214_27390 [Stenotrophomonas tumulicola]
MLTPAQRRQVARIIGGSVDQPAAPRKAAKAKKREAVGKVAANYQLPGGDTWIGWGRTTIAVCVDEVCPDPRSHLGVVGCNRPQP